MGIGLRKEGSPLHKGLYEESSDKLKNVFTKSL